MCSKILIKINLYFIISLITLNAQNYITADPKNILLYEADQFNNALQMQSNIFRPIFFNTDSSMISLTINSEFYFNNNAPNQENMDVRYFSKGVGRFNSLLFSYNSSYLSFIVEPYLMQNNYVKVNSIQRDGTFSFLNDQTLGSDHLQENSGFRNLLAFLHYKGFGFGWHKGNRWWGPGIHSSLQMTNNSFPIPTQIIGTIQEIKIGSFGLYGLYSFSKLNNKSSELKKYHTALNGQLTWYGPIIFSMGFSRNYLSGGVLSASGRVWQEKDAKILIFEEFLTTNLIDNDYTIGGHDSWDQTLSGYFSIILPKRRVKVYAEMGFNDNRLYLADLVSQPDHSMATVFGIRDYGPRTNKNLIWGFEWINLMVSYTSRHRGSGGSIPWYSRELFDFSSYKGRRWAAHSGGDSDDWYLYAGYLSDKLLIVPAINYERHGVVLHRPAEVKIEFRLDTKYKFNDIWFGVYFEKQFESFLGFPDYFYTDKIGNPINSSEGEFANTRKTNTLIISLSKTMNY